MTEASWVPPIEVVTEAWLDQDLRPDGAAAVAEEERTRFDRLAGGPDSELLLFGAGNLGRRTLSGLRSVGREPVGFVDNDPRRQGTVVDGLTVYSPESAADHHRDAAIAVTIWIPMGPLAFPSVSRQVQALGFTSVQSFVPLFWKYHEQFLPNFCLDAPHLLYQGAEDVKAAHSLFVDEDSRHEFRTQLSYLLSTMESIEVRIPNDREWYFPRDLFELASNEVFVDCGAYDGDTIESFLEATGGTFDAIIAFEPDPDAATRLRTTVGGLAPDVRARIEVRELAVGSSPGLLRFEGDGSPGSRIAETGAQVVQCVTLDDTIGTLRPTIIKMDIEGAEEGALIGAARTIRTHRPVLAICVYHVQAHLYRLPLLIAELCDSYTIVLRRQGPHGDLVCFAIPNERLGH